MAFLLFLFFFYRAARVHKQVEPVSRQNSHGEGIREHNGGETIKQTTYT